ncbi:MAG: DUF2183 domain-containing protein [Chloroflexota bacterium]|nr:MAG: DUF2183 domain-containing protein [Chloroflexota bacterium]
MDWQKSFTRFVHAVEILFDRIRYRKIDSSKPWIIIPYLGFGSGKFLDLKGRVIEDKGIQPSSETDRVWTNLLNMYRRFESDEIPYARIRARFQDLEQEVTADEEGFFKVSFLFDTTLQFKGRWQNIELELLEPKNSSNQRISAIGKALIVSPGAQYGVISDIDDTVVHTGVTSRLKMVFTVLLKNARTRLPLKGVANFYNALQQGTERIADNPLFYVSSSPWNIYDLFREFFQIHGIPLGPVILRNWGIESQSIYAVKNRKYKMDSICYILDRFPDLKFILIGDSGEEDPEIYSQVMRSYPQRILTAYIRCVMNKPQRREEIRLLAEQAATFGSALVLAEDTQTMAIHAAEQGWISLSAVSQPAQ